MAAPVTLADYRTIYESLRRRAQIATRYVELGPQRRKGGRDWREEGKQLALETASKLYWLSVKIGTIAWNRARVGNEPLALRREIEATHAELLEATRPLGAIEDALGLANMALHSVSPDQRLAGVPALRRGPHHGPSGV